MKVTGQSEKEKQFLNKIIEKNHNRSRLPREYRESEINLKGE